MQVCHEAGKFWQICFLDRCCIQRALHPALVAGESLRWLKKMSWGSANWDRYQGSPFHSVILGKFYLRPIPGKFHVIWWYNTGEVLLGANIWKMPGSATQWLIPWKWNLFNRYQGTSNEMTHTRDVPYWNDKGGSWGFHLRCQQSVHPLSSPGISWRSFIALVFYTDMPKPRKINGKTFEDVYSGHISGFCTNIG